MTRARDVANLIGSGNYSSTTFTATAGQTVFSIAHTQNFVQVFMNGLLLDLTVDYTSNGSAVTLTSGAAAGDEIEVVAYNTFSVGDALNQAAADTRYVNASGDTMTGTLVAGTRLQVGDSSITNAYSGNAALGYIADFQGSSGSQTFVSIAPPNVSSLGDNGTIIGEDGSDTYITQRNNKNIKLGTSNVNRLIIDGSGRVTMPYQPSFSASGNFGWRDYSVYSEVGTWNVGQSKSHNVGSHFNATNGRFTAPVAGRYQFNFVCYVNNTGEQYHNSKLYINNTKYADNVVSHQSSSSDTFDNTSAGVFVVNLASGDYVSLYHINDLYGYHTMFSGYLIG